MGKTGENPLLLLFATWPAALLAPLRHVITRFFLLSSRKREITTAAVSVKTDLLINLLLIAASKAKKGLRGLLWQISMRPFLENH